MSSNGTAKAQNNEACGFVCEMRTVLHAAWLLRKTQHCRIFQKHERPRHQMVIYHDKTSTLRNMEKVGKKREEKAEKEQRERERERERNPDKNLLF